MMKSSLLRTSSIPVHQQPLNRNLPHPGIIPSSPRISLHPENTNTTNKFNKMRRSYSVDTDLMSSPTTRVGSLSFADLGAILKEESFGIGVEVGSGKGNDDSYYGGKGKGKGKGGNNNNNNSNNNGNDDKSDSNIGEHYQNMLKSNPGDPLLLSNYGTYLHKVEKNTEKAEEYYGRAILANPGDGQVLSLYGNLIWETSKDQDRAQLYFDQAVQSSPNDCMVLGSYAHFLWEAEDDEEDFAEIKHQNAVFPAMIGVH